jgi:hypothetical protein
MVATPELVDRAAYFPDSETLVCADLHLGKAATGRVEFPLGQLDAIPDRIEQLTARFAPQRIVLAGDLLHAFDDVPEGAVGALVAIQKVATNADAELALIRGNHDTMLSEVLENDIQEAIRLGDDTVVCHGHEPPEIDADRYIIGHDHPAIVIEGQRRPCYLIGPHHTDVSSTVFVLPSFTPLASGVPVNDLRGDAFQSPLVGDVGQFRPAVRDEAADETLWFPTLAEFRNQL